MIVARTERIVLRHVRPGDLDTFAELFADRAVMEFSLGVKSRNETRQWIESSRAGYAHRGYGPYALVLKGEARPFGFCGLVDQFVEERHEVEIGYRLLPSYWGRGLATEAALACRELAFGELGLDRVVSMIESANVRSIRVAEKNAMRLEGEVFFWGRRVRLYAATRPKKG